MLPDLPSLAPPVPNPNLYQLEPPVSPPPTIQPSGLIIPTPLPGSRLICSTLRTRTRWLRAAARGSSA
jgi:hypothetical protein